MHRYSFLSAIASSFALATEDKPATAGRPHEAHLSTPRDVFISTILGMKKPAERHKTSQPAEVGAISCPHTTTFAMIIER